jgi:hypothetical protein
MSKKEQACALLREGHSPSQIARNMQVKASDVMNFLCLGIGEGRLRRSDVAFSLKRKTRGAIEQIIAESGSQSPGRISRELENRGIHCTRFDVRVYLNYRRAPVVLGEMYEVVRNIEVRLHRFIKWALVAEFGEGDWWRGGIPDRIRAECAALREKDPEPAPDAYNYTHLIALREILDRKWQVFARHLPAEVAENKKDLLDRLLQLNRIRNNVMHPVRGGMLTEEEFEFVYNLESDLGPLSAPQTQQPAEKQTESPEAGARDAAPELVTRLEPVEDKPAPQEYAATPQQASGEDFIPSVKAS